jgi:mannose-6-phosphate isomerase class I
LYKSNYDKFPQTNVEGEGFAGWEAIAGQIESELTRNKKYNGRITIECYHGVLSDEMISGLRAHLKTPVTFIPVQPAMLPAKEIDTLVYPFVTDDPVFGYITSLEINDFFDHNAIKEIGNTLDPTSQGIVCIYGTGASLVPGDQGLVIYADMPRWEIQLRFRKKMISNLGISNEHQPFSYQYKRAYFVDWRVCDKLKKIVLPKSDFVLDTTIVGSPKMIRGSALEQALNTIVHQPFRVVPFFDPGPWGGQWLKEVCDLDRSEKNFAWGFDCVPEENSLLLKFDNLVFETPAINLVFNKPDELLGTKVNDVFGAEFPIRFDFLDTMQGGNLSLQVHPLKAYIQQHFGMDYTQDESYYFLETGDDACVYLGLKDGIQPEEMLEDLKAAQETDSFDAEKYVGKWPVKKHDHVLIPAGTVHCSGANSVVLEISATPYIFTFKLWDWGRMGMDGKPRPISLEHGRNSIQWNRNSEYAKQHLLDQVEILAEGDGWREEKTGLHNGFFIETRRHWFTGKVSHDTGGVVNVLNLVEGREVIVESPEYAFKPFIVHYAETFIVPASVGMYTIRPHGESEGKTCATMKAFINTDNLF